MRIMGKGFNRSVLWCVVVLANIFTLTPSFADAPIKFGSFTRGTNRDDSASRAFEKGIELGIAQKSPPVLAAQFFEAAQGGSVESPQLKTLIETDQVPFVVYWKMGDIESVGQHLTSSQVIGLVSWDVTERIPYLGSYVFGFGYSTERTFQEFAKFAGSKLKSYRVGLISTGISEFDTQSKAFSEQWKSDGNTVVFDEKVDAAAPQFEPLFKRAVAEKCDTLFAALPGTAASELIKGARASGYTGKIMVGDSLFAADISALGKDAEGIYMAQSWSDDAGLSAAYSAKFGTTPDGITLGAAALGYDMMNCIQGIQPVINAGMIKSRFLSTPCEGLTGKTQFTGERIAQRRKRFLTVKGGTLALAE